MEVPENSSVWYAVVNVYAASKKAGDFWRKAENLLGQSGITYESQLTGQAGNALAITLDACRRGYRRFIAVGGDGTVHDVLNGIMDFVHQESGVSVSDFTLSVIPVGSGNDWIKTHGIPKEISQAISLFAEGVVGRQDVVKVTMLDLSALPEQKELSSRYMANVGGIGLDARICSRVNRKKKEGKRGKKLYVSSLIYSIMHRRPAFARVICDGTQVFDGPFLSMAFGIGKYSGGGMRQTPDALVDDGLLDMTIIPDLPLMKIAKEAPKLFTGKFLTVRELVVSRGESITVVPYDASLPCAVVEGEPVEVDGEVVGLSPVRLEILPQQLNVLLPRK